MFRWDPAGRLISVTQNDSSNAVIQTIEYGYDANGLMIGRRVVGADGTTETSKTGFVRQGLQVLAELDLMPVDPVITELYLHGTEPNEIVATDALGSGNYHAVWGFTDALGSLSTVASKDLGDWDVVHSVTSEYGGNSQQLGDTSVPHLMSSSIWAGHHVDQDTGLTEAKARWHDSSTGRFISQDPLGFEAGDDNLYRYVGNRPTTATDPSGLEEWKWYHYIPYRVPLNVAENVYAMLDPGPLEDGPVYGDDGRFLPAIRGGMSPGSQEMLVNDPATVRDLYDQGLIEDLDRVEQDISTYSRARVHVASEPHGRYLYVKQRQHDILREVRRGVIGIGLAAPVEVVAIPAMGVRVGQALRLADLPDAAPTAMNLSDPISGSSARHISATTLDAGARLAPKSGLTPSQRLSQVAARSPEEVASRLVRANDLRRVRDGIPSRLYHYTDEAGEAGIRSSQELFPSLKAMNPKDARYGDGQYLTDIVPGTKTPAQLSRAFIGQPFQGRRFSNAVEIDVSGLRVIRGRDGVYVIPNQQSLPLSGRLFGGSN